MPYNDLGVYKWTELRIGYALPEARPPLEEHMHELRSKLATWLPGKKVV